MTPRSTGSPTARAKSLPGYWTSIRDKCSSTLTSAVKPLIRLKDLVAYANSRRRTLAINLKNCDDHQRASQAVMEHPQVLQQVHLQAAYSNRAALNKVKKLDQADSSHKIRLCAHRRQGPAGGRRSPG